MTPRSVSASELRPEFASPVDREIIDSLTSRTDEPPDTDAPSLPQIEFGSIGTSPGLDEYLADSQQGAQALLDLAIRLQNAGHIQRAVLAYERILDSTPAGGSPRLEAEETLANLKISLPIWNADSESAIPLEINLSTARAPETLQPALTALTELITIGSGNLCQPKFQIIPSSPPTQNLPSYPIAIWLTVPGEEPDKPSLAVITIAPQSDEEVTQKLTRGIFTLLKRRIESIGNLSTPLPLSEGEDAESALVNRITRLAWKQILETPFQSLQEGPPTGNTTDEEETPATPEDEER